MKYLLCSVLLIACGKADSKKEGGGGGGAGGADKSRPAPFAVEVHKVEKLAEVAPNETYAKQGLGAKAPAGQTFACVQYTVTNNGEVKENLPMAVLVDAKGAEHQPDMSAAGKYMPADWPADLVGGAVESKKSAKQANCYTVVDADTSAMKLRFVDTGWGKHLAWKLEVDAK